MEKKHKEELRRYIESSTRTMDVLDEFEGIGEKNDTVYDRLVLTDFKYIYIENMFCKIYLVVERSKSSDYVGDITFTQYKQNKVSDLYDFLRSEITLGVIEKYQNKNEIFYFSKPFHLRAQNRLNRTGYGWEWDWSDGIGSYVRGTEYGETTDYVFSGAYIKK